MPFAVRVRDRMMYSHTFVFDDGVPFTTGCTSVVDVTFEGAELGKFDVLIDICLAQRLLRQIMEVYDHKALDTLEEFLPANNGGKRVNTTVEVMAQSVFRRMLEALKSHLAQNEKEEEKGFGRITTIRVDVKESDVACASYWESDPTGFFTLKE
eukprot:m.399790 g.399790  ORF g.399790 m.399790 type:complete len:154 (-) comp21155_c0_seq4:1520-1981(-)